jgi:hypothetical protein
VVVQRETGVDLKGREVGSVFPLSFSEVHWTSFGLLFEARIEFLATTNWRPTNLNCSEIQNWMKKNRK